MSTSTQNPPNDPASNMPKILIIDDDPITLKMVSKVLRDAGYEVSEANNGQSGLTAFQHQPVDIVLLDVMMPVMNGYETCKALRNYSDDESLQILMLTGLDDVESVNKAFEAGASDFITKPLNFPLLAQRVRYAQRSRCMLHELKENQERLENAQKIAKLGYWQCNLTDKGISISKQVANILDTTTDSISSMSDFLSYVHKDDVEYVKKALQSAISNAEPFTLQHRVVFADWSEKFIEQQGEVKTNSENQAVLIVGTMQDITDRHRAEELIHFQKFYDSLTHFPNRRMFDRHIKHALSEAQLNDSIMSLMLFSIDKSEQIVESFGHTGFDMVILNIANILKALLSENLSIYRFDENSFAIIQKDLASTDEGIENANRIRSYVAEPIVISGREIIPTASIGLSYYPYHASKDKDIIRMANLALNESRKQSDTVTNYSSTMTSNSLEQLTMEKSIREAIRKNEFIVHYQPQINVNTGMIAGMEALVRWQHPEHGILSPLQFIPIAEKSGLIIPIGEQVFTQACHTAKTINEQFNLNLRVGINLSTKQLADPDLNLIITEIIAKTGVTPQLVEIEITESAVIDDMDKAISILNNLRDKGFKIAMDDFGTGYSSLSMLQHLPLDTLKIDRAFIKDINDNGENSELARAIIAMAKSLNMHIIAEGAEEQSHYNFLKQQQADEIQGYYFSKPLSEQDFISFVQSHLEKSA